VVVSADALPWVVKIGVAEWVEESLDAEDAVFTHLRVLAPSRVPQTYWLAPLICLQERLVVDEDRAEPLMASIRAELNGLGVWLNDHEPYQYGFRASGE
jgi:hypothetical protein